MAKQAVDINIPAVIASLVCTSVFGMFWFSPMMFGNLWAAALGIDLAAMNADFKSFMVPFGVGTLCGALALYIRVHFMAFIKKGNTKEGCISVMFWGWLAFSFLPGFSDLLWDKGNSTLFLIHQGAHLCGALISSLIYVTLSATGGNEAAPASPRGRSRSPRRRTPVKRM